MQNLLFPILALIVAAAGVAYYWRSHQRRREERPRRAMSDEQYNLSRHEQQKRIDAILDKISQKGLDSLSKEERALLENYR